MNNQTKSTVLIHRIADNWGAMRELEVFIDNKMAGELQYSNQKVFHLDPGIHEIYVKMDWCRSKPLTVDLKDNESLELYCGARFTGTRWLLNLVIPFFCPRSFYFIGTEPNKKLSTSIDERIKYAKIKSLFYTILLLIPVVGLLHLVDILLVNLSVRIFGPVSSPILILNLLIIVGFAYFCFKYLKNYFEKNPTF